MLTLRILANLSSLFFISLFLVILISLRCIWTSLSVLYKYCFQNKKIDELDLISILFIFVLVLFLICICFSSKLFCAIKLGWVGLEWSEWVGGPPREASVWNQKRTAQRWKLGVGVGEVSGLGNGGRGEEFDFFLCCTNGTNRKRNI